MKLFNLQHLFNMSKITAPIATVITAFMVCLTLLIATGSLTPTPKNYATVKFDGGYQKIGIISSESMFTQASIEFNGSKSVSGSFNEVIDVLKSFADGGDLSKRSLKTGSILKASAGIKWEGSSSNFKLTTDSILKVSTESKPITIQSVIDDLYDLEAKAKAARVSNSESALEFSASPTNGSFLASKIINALTK